MTTKIEKKHLNKEQIKNILPHREPLLLADSAETDTAAGSLRTYFYVDPEMDIFKGHFPDDPVFPGAYIIEAMAQCAGLLLLSCVDNPSQKPYLASVMRMRFIRPVHPGDTLACQAELTESDVNIYTFNVTAQVDSETAAKGSLSLTLV